MTQLMWYPGHDLLLNDIVKAENCHLYDSRGNKYVDLESGVWCTSIGHGNVNFLRVLAEQSRHVMHTGFNYTSATVEHAARDILSLLGFEGGKCVFLCSGSEAVEYSVRVAQMLIERPLFITMIDSYCGTYGSASRKEADEWFTFDWGACAQCPHGGASGACSDACEHWAAIPFDRIGGFLLEPGSSSGLVRFPPNKLIRSIAARVKASGGLLLVNEVTTGIGRTGTWFGYMHYGITPDIVAIGKGIGNGYPVSVTACAPHVASQLGDRPVKFASSHQNDPLGAAVAREVIRFIREEGLIERSREISAALLAGLDGIKERTGRIEEIRARGMMVGIEVKDDSGFAFTTKTHRELIRRGFVLARRPDTSVLRLDPSLTIERKDIEDFLRTFEDVLTAAR